MIMKLCECGCGQPAPIATRDFKSKGIKKGQSFRFIKGHNHRGKPHIHRGKSRRPVQERFWENVDKFSESECWLWKGTIGTHGYGSINIGNKEVRAHRLSYEINKGPIPEGLNVLHSCDNPGCVNPNHLWAGTQKQNIQDMIIKGRRRKY